MPTAARIEAGNTLSIDAGRDFNTIGSVVRSGNDLTIDAGRDVNVVSAQKSDRITDHGDHDDSAIKQLASEVTAGRDLDVTAGRNLTAIASDLEAKRDVGMSAGGDMTLASAADEVHAYNKGSSVTRKEDHVSQVATTVKAGGDVVLGAGNDMTLIASRISAANEAYLVAQNKLQLLAAQNSNYTLYDMEKKGGWGSKKTQRDEVTDVKNIGSEISAGGDLTLVSGGDQRYQVARLESGDQLTLQSGGAITFEAVKDLHQESHTKSDTSLAWNSMKGKGNTDETLRQSQLVAKGELVIKAVDGLNIDIKQINQKTVSQTIDAMVEADPQLAWLKEAEQRGDVDWRLVKETHDSFKYSNSSLGQGAMLAIIIIVTVLTAGTASAAVGTAASATAGSGTAMAASGVATGAALTGGAAVGSTVGAGLGNIMASAALTSMASGAAVSAINNQGNLGTVTKDVISSDSLKGYVLAAASAGIASQFGFNPTTLKFDLASAQSVAIKVAADAAAKTVITGGSLKDNLAASALGAAISIGGAVSANKIGDITVFSDGKLSKVVMHAALGGLMAEAMGGDFRTGALAGGANEALVDVLADKLLPVGVDRNSLEYQQGVSKLLAASQLIGVLTAALTGGDASAAAAVAANATQYNNLDHPSAERLLKELDGCRTTKGCSAANIREIVGRYEELSAQRSMAINACKSRACVEAIQKSAVSLEAPVAKDLMDFLRRSVSYDMAGLLTGNPGAVAVPSQGVDGWGALFTSDKHMAFAKNLKEGWLTPSELEGVDQWVKETSWLDQQVGRQLSLLERAGLLTELKTTLSMEILGRSPVVAGVGGTKKPPTSSSTTGEKGPCCFAAGTMVSTPQGDRAIETLKVGDVVWSKPEKGGKPFAAAILATHQRSDQPIYRLKLRNVRDDGSAQVETLLVTPSHPFYVPAKRDFIPVSDLKRGDLLQSLADGETENTSSKVESLELYAPVGKTYNLTVDIGHTFYVGELKTWVHNTGPCGLPEGGGNSQKATAIDTASLAQRVMDVRAGLPSDLRRSGNVAVAEIDIPGIPKQMAAHSQVSEAGKGLIGSGNGSFVAQSVPNKAGDLVYRGIDTEYKILDNIAAQLGGNTSVRGAVSIFTEKAACESCLNVAEQFKARYPNITVNILDNQGVMLRPPRKSP